MYKILLVASVIIQLLVGYRLISQLMPEVLGFWVLGQFLFFTAAYVKALEQRHEQEKVREYIRRRAFRDARK